MDEPKNPFEDIQSIVAYRAQPGDVLFMLHPRVLSEVARERIREGIRAASPGTALEGVRVIVLEEGMRPEVLRAPELAEEATLARWGLSAKVVHTKGEAAYGE
jgi:hypothetical protein